VRSRQRVSRAMAGCGRPTSLGRNRRVPTEPPIPAQLARSVPVIDRELPSTLLQRRPDVARAERAVAAANAQIGVGARCVAPRFHIDGRGRLPECLLFTVVQGAEPPVVRRPLRNGPAARFRRTLGGEPTGARELR